jgi:hypothetical protein
VRFEGRKIDGDEFVIFSALISLELPSSIGVGAVAGEGLESFNVLVRLRSPGRVKVSS